MNKTCKVCGHQGENVWRDNKYFCASCGSEIDTTQPETKNYIYAVCPICKNEHGNYIENGLCRCSMCGSSFNISQQPQYTPPQYNNYGNSGYGAAQQYNPYYANDPARAARRAMLEQEKSKKLVWGIIWAIFCWPVSIYYFYKVYQIGQEIKTLY